MTAEEAIAILKNPKSMMSDVIDAYEIAIEALEKQVLRKVTVKDRGGWRCPVCRCYIYWPQGRYCSICGQALDWSENK